MPFFLEIAYIGFLKSLENNAEVELPLIVAMMRTPLFDGDDTSATFEFSDKLRDLDRVGPYRFSVLKFALKYHPCRSSVNGSFMPIALSIAAHMVSNRAWLPTCTQEGESIYA